MDKDDLTATGERRAPVTDRVNVEPAILQGMTVTEAKFVGLAALVVCSLLSALVWALTGVWQVILVLSTFGPAAILWIVSGRLAGIKRGRPDGYYSQAIHLWLADRGFVRCKFIRHHGQWSLGRSFGADLTSQMDMRRSPEAPNPDFPSPRA